MTMLTARQVAQLLGLSQRAVYDVPEADLPRYRLGASRGAVRFAQDDVEEYRRRCRSAGIPGTSAGATSSTAVFKAGANGLLAYFQRAGVAPRLTPTIAPKARASTQLRLASNKQTP